jgi:hypothetical protein
VFTSGYPIRNGVLRRQMQVSMAIYTNGRNSRPLCAQSLMPMDMIVSG